MPREHVIIAKDRVTRNVSHVFYILSEIRQPDVIKFDIFGDAIVEIVDHRYIVGPIMVTCGC